MNISNLDLKKTTIILFISGCILMLIGTFYDLQIDQFLTGKLQFYGKFFETFGLLPFTIVRLFCMTYFIRIIKLDNKAIDLIVKAPFLYFSMKYVANGLMFVYLMLYSWITTATPNFNLTTIITFYILGFIITVITTYLLFKIERQKLLLLLKRVIMVFICTIIINHEVNFLKTHVGRARFYVVQAKNGVYTPWYVNNPNTTNDDFMSFVSGHTADAFSLVLLTFFTLPKQVKLRNILYISGVSFGIIVAFSRMVLSKHYLTDTIGSMLMITITIFILCKIFKIKLDWSDINEKIDDEI